MGTCPTKEVKVHEGRDVLGMKQGNKPNEASGQWNRRKKEINFNNLVGIVIKTAKYYVLGAKSWEDQEKQKAQIKLKNNYSCNGLSSN